MVSVVQTATDLLEWSPHVHALVSRGGWTRDGTWVPVPYVDARAAELLFRHKVIPFLREEGLLSEERIELLLSWQNTGFSVHNGVTVGAEDAAGIERLARYLLRPPLSLEQMSLDADRERNQPSASDGEVGTQYYLLSGLLRTRCKCYPFSRTDYGRYCLW
jgi:hypothetical protein